MRIGIDYRFLSAGPRAVNRGMGRYTQQQLLEVLARDQESEYILFCYPDADVSLVLPSIKQSENVKIEYISYPGLANREDHTLKENVLRHSAQFQEWIFRKEVDLYHATTPFIITDLLPLQFDVCPMVGTMYDLIPLIFPDHYLPAAGPARGLYVDALQSLSDASRLIAISESARVDATLYMGFPRERIDLAYPIADPSFRPLATQEARSMLSALRRRVSIPEQYVLSVTYFHHTKNLWTLLAAYAMLPLTIRRAMPLVLTFIVEDSDLDYLHSMTDQYGITDSVIFTGLVSDDEMVALYNSATMVVHPSRYEGFGLPVVEAMRCGTPVITTTASSMPEVGGDAAILVNPDDVRAFADAIESVYSEPMRRAMMRERGLLHAERFSPEQLAESTIACYRRAVQDNEQTAAILRPRIALWSPLPPAHSGIADYSAELLVPLSTRADVEIFVDDAYRPTREMLASYRIQHHSAFERRQEQRSFDVILYQLGASPFHLYMEEYIEKYPGIVTLHDLVWGLNLYVDRVGRKNDIERFKREVLAHEGWEALQTFERLLSDSHGLSGEEYWARLDEFFRKYLMLRGIIDNSLAQIVHMRLDDELRATYESAWPHSFPMGIKDPWHGFTVNESARFRSSIGAQPNSFVIGVFGALDPIKRVAVTIRAFSHLLDYYPNSLLFIVGGAPGETYPEELQRLVAELQLRRRIIFTGRVSEDDFAQYLLACDVVVNLRYPSRLQMSAVLMRAIAAGKPTIITDLPEWRFLSDEFCLKVAPGSTELADLAEQLRILAQDQALCIQMGQSARAYYEREATLPTLADHYLDVITAVAAQSYRDVAQE